MVVRKILLPIIHSVFKKISTLKTSTKGRVLVKELLTHLEIPAYMYSVA